MTTCSSTLANWDLTELNRHSRWAFNSSSTNHFPLVFSAVLTATVPQVSSREALSVSELGDHSPTMPPENSTPWAPVDTQPHSPRLCHLPEVGALATTGAAAAPFLCSLPAGPQDVCCPQCSLLTAPAWPWLVCVVHGARPRTRLLPEEGRDLRPCELGCSCGA